MLYVQRSKESQSVKILTEWKKILWANIATDIPQVPIKLLSQGWDSLQAWVFNLAFIKP